MKTAKMTKRRTRRAAGATYRLMRARALRGQLNSGAITPETGAAALWALYHGDAELALADLERMRGWMRTGLVAPTPAVVRSIDIAEGLALDARDEAEADLVDAERDPPVRGAETN